MNRFVIVDGLPYLYADGRTYAVRWDDSGFTVGAEVKLTSALGRTYSELSIKAKCAEHLDSIKATRAEVPLEEMSLKELRAYADANGIELNGARTKAEIIAVITDAKEQAVS